MEGSGNIVVSVDSAIHKALREMARAVYAEHGLLIERVDIVWDSESFTMSEPGKIVVADVVVRTTSCK